MKYLLLVAILSGCCTQPDVTEAQRVLDKMEIEYGNAGAWVLDLIEKSLGPSDRKQIAQKFWSAHLTEQRALVDALKMWVAALGSEAVDWRKLYNDLRQKVSE